MTMRKTTMLAAAASLAAAAIVTTAGPAIGETTCYNFDGTAHGFTKRVDNTDETEIRHDAANGRVSLLFQYGPIGDTAYETFAADVSPAITPDESFTVTARWRATTQGNGQGGVPIFLGPSGVTNPYGANTLSVVYYSQDVNIGESPRYYGRFSPSAGGLRLDEQKFLSPNTEYELVLDYAKDTRRAKVEVQTTAGTLVLAGAYTVPAGESFSFATIGMGAGFTGVGFNEQETIAWVDDVCLTRSGTTPPPPACANPPTNRAPAKPAIGGADGMLDGSYGWKGYLYDFAASAAVDPDGDPVRYTWAWGDGKTDAASSAATKAHKYAAAGKFRVTLAATDDPSGRNVAGCPTLGALGATSDAYGFEAIGDFVAALTRLEDGRSCIADQEVPSPAGRNVIVANCKLEAEVDTGTAPASLVARVEWHLDGETKAKDRSAPYNWNYDSTRYRAGAHELAAVAFAVGDKHLREFSSEDESGPYSFLNVGAG